MVIAGSVPPTGRQDHPLEVFLKYAEPFVCGGAGGVLATTMIQPIDTVKVRLQVLGEGKTNFKMSPIQVCKNLVASEGVGALYTGLQAAWLRQVMYGATRLGMFHSLSNAVKSPGEGTIPVYKKIACGITAGGIGAFVGNPADLALTRMQSDATLPAAQQRKYTGVFNAIQRIMNEEGVRALWRGALPTISRAAAVTAGQMATYDTTKRAVAPWLGGHSQNKEAWPVRIFAACCSGGVAALAGLPFDMTKTRMMRQTADASGRMPYRNMLDCAAQIVAKEGPLALWTGLPTFLVRLAPHTILTLLFMDMILPRYRAGREVATQWLHRDTLPDSAV